MLRHFYPNPIYFLPVGTCPVFYGYIALLFRSRRYSKASFFVVWWGLQHTQDWKCPSYVAASDPLIWNAPPFYWIPSVLTSGVYVSSHGEYHWHCHVMTRTHVSWMVTFHQGAAPLLLFAWLVSSILPVGLCLGNMVDSKRALIGSVVLVLR